MSGTAHKLKEEADEHRNTINSNKQAYEDAANTYKACNDFIIAQDNLGTAILTGNKEEINKALETMTSTYETETGTQTATFVQRIGNQIAFSNQLRDQLKANNREITEDEEAALNAGLKAVVDNLKEHSVLINGELSQDIIDGWKALGESNREVYNEAIKDVDEDVRQKIQQTTGIIVSETNNTIPKVESASEQIRKAIEKTADGSYRINFNADVDYSDLKRKLQAAYNMFNNMSNVPLMGNAFKSYKNNISSLLNQLSNAGYASGGFPEMGEIFMAREAGPELVGRIGRRTAVANNAQIVEAVSNGVYTAVAEAMQTGNNSGSMTVSGKLNGKELVQFTINGINGVKQQTGECPIEII